MKTFYIQLPNLLKSIWLQLLKKCDFYNHSFDSVIDLPNSIQITDDVPTTEDIFFTFLHDRKQIIDDILKDINHYIMQYKPITATTKTTIKKEPESLNFKDILPPKRKKKPSLLAASKAIRKNYKKLRQKKNHRLKIIKEVSMHLSDALELA